MIFETICVLLLLQGVRTLSRLIEHRRDVLDHVLKPDPRW
jgi:hypothetical protein